MRRLLLLITGLLLLFSLEGQILRYSNYTAPEETPDFYDEFDPVYAAFSSKPHIDTATFMEAMVYSLDTCDFAGGASVWDRMDVFYVLANRTLANTYVNWVNPGSFDITDPSSTAPTFAAYEGFTGDGSSDWLSTNYNPYSDYTNYSLNSATVGVYCRTASISGNYVAVGGRSSATAITRLYLRNASNEMASYLNDDSPASYANATSQGLAIISRTASNYSAIYMNGTPLASGLTSSSNEIPNQDLAILANYTSGVGASLFFPGQLSIVFVMDGVTASEVVAINTIIETFMDAIGKGVE